MHSFYLHWICCGIVCSFCFQTGTFMVSFAPALSLLLEKPRGTESNRMCWLLKIQYLQFEWMHLCEINQGVYRYNYLALPSEISIEPQGDCWLIGPQLWSFIPDEFLSSQARGSAWEMGDKVAFKTERSSIWQFELPKTLLWQKIQVPITLTCPHGECSWLVS
jgi:hypothetical protein